VLEFVRSNVEVPKGHERVGSMNMGLQGLNPLRNPDLGGLGTMLPEPRLEFGDRELLVEFNLEVVT
jgi:hypothetical protein